MFFLLCYFVATIDKYNQTDDDTSNIQKQMDIFFTIRIEVNFDGISRKIKHSVNSPA